jgi:tetratricopeptide (TPR) repeat protein
MRPVARRNRNLVSDADAPNAREIVDALLSIPEQRDRMRRLRGLLNRPGTPRLVEELRESAASALRRDPREADRRARLGLAAADAACDLGGRAACLIERAKACVMSGDAAAALGAVEEASRIARRLGDDAALAQAELVRLQPLIVLERHEEARACGERALAGFVRRDDANGRILAHMALADLAFRLDRPRDSLRHYAQVDRDLPSTAPAQAHAALAMNRANSLAACNRFRAAERHFERARGLFRTAGCEHTAAQADYNAAYCDFQRGRYQDALRRYAECEPVFRRLDDARHLAHVDLDRAEIHLHLGMPDDGASLAASAEEKFETIGLAKERAQAVFLRARADEMRGDATKAVDQFERAERLFQRLGLAERALACVVARAGLAERRDDRALARKLARAARRLVAGPMNPISKATVDLLFARLDLADGERAAAIASAESVVELCRRVHAPLVLVEALRLVGRARSQLREPAAAMTAYARAVDQLEGIRGGVPPDEYTASFLGGRAAFYDEVVEASAQTGDAANAFEYAERAKSQALADLLAARRAGAKPPCDAGPSTSRLRHLRERLHAVYESISRRDDGRDARSARFVDEARGRAKGIEEDVAALLRRRRLAPRPAASPDVVDPPDLGALREGLDPATAVVEYVVAERALYAFAMTTRHVHVARRDLRRDELSHLVDRCRYHVLRGRDAGPEPTDPILCTTRNELGSLGDLLLEPIASCLDGMRRVVVVPHGELNRLPFHALHWNGSWLSDAFEVLHAPSAATYRVCRGARPSATGAPAVFGLSRAPAPRVEDECRRVARAIGRAKLYLRDDATIERLREEATHARVLHVATHGMARRGRPTPASIGLADRGLDLDDLYDLDVRGELVVLSSCGSDDAGADEIFGLVRGVLHAGAPAALTSQWAVDGEAAAQFLERFHQALRGGCGAASAHRRAMSAIRARHPHPYFWASYALAGCPVEARRRTPSARGDSDADSTTLPTAARRGRTRRKGSTRSEERT